MSPLYFIVPGRLDQLTGGYRFDHRLVTDLRAQSHAIEVIELAGMFPRVDALATEACELALQSLPDQSRVVIDGLALPGFEQALPRHSERLRIVVFVHHPLSAETGLSETDAQRMVQLEARLWQSTRGALCPSEDSAARVRAAGLSFNRVAVTPPGTDPVPDARLKRPLRPQASTARAPIALLAVGTVTPRKGHRVLIEALGSLRDLPWTLTCIGSLERDRTCSDDLRRLITLHQFQDRIHLMGEVSDAELGRAYSKADIFVLPSFHEGYGMVFAEALAWGLPIIATRGGAIPQTVPEQAGLLIEPGDVEALTDALGRLITHPDLRGQLAAAARAAGLRLPTWPQAAQHWLQQFERLAA
jgi:glycosyltransferase involved in cell wall biosynthesis